MDFDAYLKEKKIDATKFRLSNTEQYQELKVLFDQVHPDSFTQQKLFLINKTRRAYPYKEVVAEKKTATKAMRPKIPLKPKK